MQILKIADTLIPMRFPTQKPLTTEALQRECDYHRSVKIQPGGVGITRMIWNDIAGGRILAKVSYYF